MSALRCVGFVDAACRACPDCGAAIIPTWSLTTGTYTAWCTCPRKPTLRPDGTPRAPGEIMTLEEMQDIVGRMQPTATAREPRKLDRRRMPRVTKRRLDDKRRARLRR